MPEYLAPGVYVEETSFRNKTIEGMSTSNAAFVGPTRFGPDHGEPELLTSFNDFERIYGGLDQLEFDGNLVDNQVAHAVRAFFEEGGRRLYVARVIGEGAASANAVLGEATSPPTTMVSPYSNFVRLSARYAGKAANVVVKFTFRRGRDILAQDARGRTVLRGARDHDLVLVEEDPAGSPSLDRRLFWLDRFLNTETDLEDFRLREDAGGAPSGTEPTVGDSLVVGPHKVYVVTVSVAVGAMGVAMSPLTWEGLTFHPEHEQSLSRVFETKLDRLSRSTQLFVPLEISTDVQSGAQIAAILLSQRPTDDTGDHASPPAQYQTILEALIDVKSTDANRSFSVELEDGTDGSRPTADAYEGDEGDTTGLKSGFKTLEDLEDVSIVAAPGATADYANNQTDADTINRHLISHCERMRYRIAVLDSAQGHLISEVRNYRGQLDSKYAALYYPWICILDPVTRQEIKLPPSGFVAGIYARNDIEHGVHKAPANEVVRLAIGFELLLNKGQQDVLNPEGVNCFRFFEGRGYRLWGARTISSDPEWKYVNLRRYFGYLERSIDKGTQWVVFENNSEPLWANVRSTIEDFLYNEWKNEHLMGESPKEAYFVKCDRSTMTQNDIDNGRLVCLIGVAPVRPAEFVIFRIGQWTATRRS